MDRDPNVLAYFCDISHAIATDRCADAQLAARKIACKVAKQCSMVVAVIVRMVKSWLESATKSEKAVADLDYAVFKGKFALGKTLKYSSKKRKLLNAY